MAELSVNVQITGEDALLNSLRAFASQAGQAFAAALVQEAEVIMADAKARTPVDTGSLRGTGHVQPPQGEGDETSVTMGFGGPAAEYAVFVHENLTAHHPVGEAKFLERAVLAAAPDLAKRLAARVRL